MPPKWETTHYILCIASLGGPPIGGQDRDGVSNRRSALYTLCLFEAFPSRGNEKYGEEKQRVIYFMYHFGVSPFGGWRHHLSPSSRGHYKAPLCCEPLMKGLLCRALFCPRLRGKSGAARIGGGERSEPVSRMVILPYDTESKSVTLTLYSSPCGRYRNPRPEGPSNLRTLRPIGPVHLKNLSLYNPSAQPAASAASLDPVNPQAAGAFPFQIKLTLPVPAMI